MEKRNSFTFEDAKEFNRLHNNEHITLRQIGVLYKTSHNTIKNNLAKHGFEYKSRQYPLNETYFSELDTPEKQYFLGWIYSDGCVFAYEENHHYGFFIKVQERDQYILEYFKKCLYSHAKIRIEIMEGRRYSKLTIGSKKIYDDLLKYGLRKRKTHFLTYPEKHITDHRAFILGLFEGDGTITIKKNKMAGCGITGAKGLMQTVNEIIARESDLNLTKLRKTKNSYRFSYEGTRPVQKVGNWLYSWNPSVFLKRKRDLFEIVLEAPKYGKNFVVFKCPHCETLGDFEKRHISQLKKYTFKSKFCSLSCSGSFYREFQLNSNTLTPEMKLRLEENIVIDNTRYKLTDINGGFTDYTPF